MGASLGHHLWSLLGRKGAIRVFAFANCHVKKGQNTLNGCPEAALGNVKKVAANTNNCQQAPPHSTTFTRTPSLCELNSGAYMHCAVVMPLLKSPLWVTRKVYSNT